MVVIDNARTAADALQRVQRLCNTGIGGEGTVTDGNQTYERGEGESSGNFLHGISPPLSIQSGRIFA